MFSEVVSNNKVELNAFLTKWKTVDQDKNTAIEDDIAWLQTFSKYVHQGSYYHKSGGSM